jgi:hypothetical protein
VQGRRWLKELLSLGEYHDSISKIQTGVNDNIVER